MNRPILLTLLLCLLGVPAQSMERETNRDSLLVARHADIAVRDGRVIVRFLLSAPSKAVGGNDRYRLTPELMATDSTLPVLPPYYINKVSLTPLSPVGRRKSRSEHRRAVLGGRAASRNRLIESRPRLSDTTRYEISLPYEEWMGFQPLSLWLTREKESYSRAWRPDSKTLLSPQSLLSGVRLLAPWQRSIPLLRPVSGAGAQPVCFSLCESSATPVTTRGQSQLPAGETVRVLVYRTGSTSATDFVGENTYYADPNESGRLTPCTVDATGMVTGQGEELFLVPGQTYDIHAYSPALPTADRKTVTGIKHGTDLLGSKLTLKLEKFTPSVTLAPLVHQCAMMEFTIQGDPTDPSVLDLSAESVTLINMSREPGSYLLNSTTGVTPPGNNPDATVQMEAFNKLGDTKLSASQVVLPKAVGNFDLELKVLINGTKYTLSTPVNNLKLEAKKKYNWVVTCKREGITLSFSVTNWEETPFDSNAGTPAPLQEPANSFMVTPGRGISFKAVRPDGSSVGSVTRAEVLWQTRDGGNPVIERPTHVVWDNESQRIRVYTNIQATNGGKAVVVARNAGNVELYRWLVWVTPYNPWGALNGALKDANKSITDGVVPGGAAVHTYDTNFLAANGKQTVIMDRNLGATAPTDAGCNFQHGSRMAYRYGETLYEADGTTIYTQPAVPSTAPATGWTAVTINGTDATGAKSVEDPCPYGWRVPANNGTATSTWSAFDTSTFTGSNSGRTYGNGVNAYYPTGCWGTHRTGSNGYALLFTGSSVSPFGSQSAATQLPVRCVQDATVFGVGTPIMEAVTVSDISATGATFNCRMTSTGGAIITKRGFYYHTQPFVDGVGATSAPSLGSLNEPAFKADVSDLTQGITYYVQAYIQTSGGTFYSPLVQFVPSGLPKVSTGNATSTGPTTATVDGNAVTDTGGDAAVKRGVVYSTTSNFDPQSQGTQVEAGTSGIGSYAIPLTGLQPGTLYYVRAYATNKVATAYGVQRSFTTVGVPTFSNPQISNLMGTTVTFRSVLTGPLPTPGVTEWGFEWSTSADFPVGAGTASAAVPDNTSHPTGKSFEFPATGLKDNTTYYVRAYGKNTAGTGYSASLRFITPQLPSVVTLPSGGATYIGTNGKVPVTLNGEVMTIGSGALDDRGFEYSTTAGFAGGTGIKVSAGSGGASAGKFAVPSNVFESDRTYYIRAYATNLAGTGYGEIRSERLDYVCGAYLQRADIENHRTENQYAACRTKRNHSVGERQADSARLCLSGRGFFQLYLYRVAYAPAESL